MSAHVEIFIRRCPECCGTFRHVYVLSSVAMWIWTDGRYMPMTLAGYHRLLPCPKCRALIWADQLEQIPYDDRDTEIRCAPFVKGAPTCKQYRLILERGGLSRDKEIDLRIRMWWLDNDTRRRSDSKAPELCRREAAEIAALVDLLDEEDEYLRILKAEALRELGRFDEARPLLDQKVSSNYQGWGNGIRSLIDRGDTRVRKVEARYTDFFNDKTV